MSTATRIKHLPSWSSNADLYRLDPPLQGHEFVAVSALEAPTHDPKAPGGVRTHLETYIFAADADGTVDPDMTELPGSMAGTLDHREALLRAGYEVTA